MKPPGTLFKQVTVVGMGLLGGSVGMALKKRKLVGRVVGIVRADRPHKPILDAHAADALTSDYAEGVSGSQCVLLCVPVPAIPACAQEVARHLAPDTIVTDVGSAKGSLVGALQKIFGGKGRYVGSHPMAGSEKTGIDAARPDLFEKAVCILTPTARSNADALGVVETLWKALGMRIGRCSPEEHDRIVASVSHLPHLMAVALMHVANADPSGDATTFAGPAFRDMTRIAASSPRLWTDILLANRQAVGYSVALCVKQLEKVRDCLDRGDRSGIMAFLENNKNRQSV